MKKIFLIPLLACSFCICAYANSAKIGTTDYPTVTAAIGDVAENAADWTTIVLTGDEQEYIVIPANKKIILNLNGHSIQSEGDEEAWDLYKCCTIYNQGSLRIIEEGDGMVSSPAKAGMSSCPIVNASTGELIIDGGVFVAKCVVFYTGVTFPMPVIWGEEKGNKVTINGGIFVQQAAGTKFNDRVVASINDEDFTVNGGDFNNNQDTQLVNNVSDGYVGEWIDFSRTFGGVSVTRLYHVYAASTGTTYSTDTEITEDVETTDILVKEGVTVTLKKDHKITCKTIAFEDENAKLIIEAGATLIVEDEIRSSSVDNIHMTMDGRDNGDGNSYLLIKAGQLQDAHPLATVVLKSKAYHNTTLNKDVFQRFAVPTYLPNLLRNDMQYDHEAAPTAVYRWDYSLNDWKVMKSTDTDNRYYLPFHCYEMTTDNVGTPYTFQCELVGNGTPELELHGKWNYYANSYTAPIDIVTMIQDIEASYAHIKPAVWVHNGTRNGWDAIAALDVEDYVYDPSGAPLSQTKIEPMQAFVYNWADQTVTTKPELKYDSYVYDPIVPSNSNNAPARRAASSGINYTRATITVTDASGEYNTLKMYESEEFGAFDNNYSVEKLMNKDCFNMYFVTADGAYSNIAAENFANTAITLQTKEATSYTINFKNVTLEGYAIRDNLTGTVTAIANGNSYNFSTEANSTVAGRFEVIKVHNAPTAIENTAEAVQNKGIYTLTGLYMGEDYHALPSGMYIINGKKVVK